LAHRARIGAYSTAGRRSGPVILRYGQQQVKATILPRIASGELCFCIGLSEPNSGSDVFAASTRATKTEGGWLVNGRKIWTSNAHNSDYMIALLRTSPPTKENRRHGLTQFLIALDTPGITTRPIVNLAGGRGGRGQGPRHQLGAGSAQQGAADGAGLGRLDARVERRPLRAGLAPYDADRAQIDDPGRHPRGVARHHRPRPRIAVKSELF